MGVTLTEAGVDGECNVTPAQAAKLNNLDLKISSIKVLIDAVEAKLDDPSKGLANLKALIDALEGKLDSDVYGLSVLKTLIDAIEAKLDDPSKGLTALKTLIDAIEAKLDNGTYGLAALNADLDIIIAALANATYGLPALNIDLDTTIALLGTPAGASMSADIADIEAKLDNGTWGLSALNDDLDTLLARLTLARAGYLDYIPVTAIESESVYVATAGAPLTANAEYPILEILVSGGVIYVYRYNHTSGNVPAAPDEMTGRTEITHFSGDVFELSKLFVNINKATTGLWTKMGASDIAYIYAKYYDATAGAFVLVPDIAKRDKAVDTLISSPPVDTDLGEAIVFDGAKLQLASRFIIYFYNNANITSQVDIPFTFAVRRC